MKVKNLLLIIVIVGLLSFVSINLQGQIISILDLYGFTKVDIEVEPGVIHLTANCLTLSMVTTDLQTASIESGISGEVLERPTAHDLMKEIFDTYNISVSMVKIISFDNGTYYARLVLKRENTVLNLDSRPSDAIAIAVRTKAPVYIKDEILAEQGAYSC